MQIKLAFTILSLMFVSCGKSDDKPTEAPIGETAETDPKDDELPEGSKDGDQNELVPGTDTEVVTLEYAENLVVFDASKEDCPIFYGTKKWQCPIDRIVDVSSSLSLSDTSKAINVFVLFDCLVEPDEAFLEISVGKNSSAIRSSNVTQKVVIPFDKEVSDVGFKSLWKSSFTVESSCKLTVEKIEGF